MNSPRSVTYCGSTCCYCDIVTLHNIMVVDVFAHLDSFPGSTDVPADYSAGGMPLIHRGTYRGVYDNFA